MRDCRRVETGSKGGEWTLWKAYRCDKLWGLAAGRIPESHGVTSSGCQEAMILTARSPESDN